ncbi:hypothetical protein AB0F18_23940 [Streptomyces sp. NPDC029216]
MKPGFVGSEQSRWACAAEAVEAARFLVLIGTGMGKGEALGLHGTRST